MTTETSGPVVKENDACKVPRPPSLKLSELDLAVNDRIEVSWDLEMTDGSEESVWWTATILVEAEDGITLEYEAQHGFDKEQRRAIISSDCVLWDCSLRENLDWRREGTGELEYEEQDGHIEGGLTLDSAVKARFQGGEFHAGTIAAINEDGTFDVLYEDNVLEQGVPREMIELVKIDENTQDAIDQERGEGPVAETISDFFELFVRLLTSGEQFSKLTAEQKAIASEKVRGLQPHFEAELVQLRNERGRGAPVTGTDINVLLPRVMARSRQTAA